MSEEEIEEHLRAIGEAARAPVCALCGYSTLGDFYVGIPGEPRRFMHSISCGPVLNGQEQVAEPTHRRLPDGTYQKIEE